MEAVVEATVLRDIVGALSSVSDTVRVDCYEKGIEVKAVDKDHVSMVGLFLAKDGFLEYKVEAREAKGESGKSANPTENFKVSLTKLREILSLVGSGEVRLLSKDDSIIVKVGRLRRKMKPAEANPPANIPTLKLPCSVTLHPDSMALSLRACESIRDIVRLSIGHGVFTVRSESDSDDVEGVFSKSTGTLTSLVETDRPVYSDFRLQFLQNVLRGVSSDSVTFHLGQDYPVRISFEFAEGHGTVEYLLAPRVEG